MASVRQNLLTHPDDRLREYPAEYYGYMGFYSLKDSGNQQPFGVYDFSITPGGNKKTSYSDYKEDMINRHLHEFMSNENDVPLGYSRIEDIEPEEGTKRGQQEYIEDELTMMQPSANENSGPGDDDDDELIPVERGDDDDDDDLLIDDDDDDDLVQDNEEGEDEDSGVDRSSTGSLGTNISGREPGRTTGRMIDHEPGTSGI